MRSGFGLPCGALFAAMLSASAGNAAPNTNAGETRLPVTFEANQGQAGGDVRYLARTSRYTLALTLDAAEFRLPRSVVSMRISGSRRVRAVEGVGPVSGVSNYFIGNDASKWHAGVPHFDRARMRGDDADLEFYGVDSQLEYDLVIRPGVDPRGVGLTFGGMRSLRIDRNGDLVAKTSDGDLRQHKPNVYQEIDGRRRPVEASFVLRNRHEVGFKLGDTDPSRPVVIDPGLTYSTYLGGSDDEEIFGMATDSSGNVTGFTLSANFPTKSAFRPNRSELVMAFVTKINPSVAGSAGLVYSTYFGGSSSSTQGVGIAVDGSGNVIVAGSTSSADFPVAGPYVQPYTVATCDVVGRGSAACWDVFVAKFDPTGSHLLYSTCLGGTGDDLPNAVAVDRAGKVYLAGSTSSIDFPLSSGVPPAYAPYQYQSRNGATVFITVLDPSVGGRAALIYSTYLGGASGTDAVNSMALDAANNIYLGGQTTDRYFPTTTGAYLTQYPGTASGWVAKVTPAKGGLDSLAYSTLLTGANDGTTQVLAVAVDSAGAIYATGATSSSKFPVTVGAYQTSNAGPGYFDAFVTRLNPQGKGAGDLLYSTYIGGSGQDGGNAIAVDAKGMVYVAGASNWLDFPYTVQYSLVSKVILGTNDVFLGKMNLSLPGKSALLSMAGFFGENNDTTMCMVLDPSGAVWVGGNTISSSFPVLSSAVQTKYGGAGQQFDTGDGFLLRYDFTPASTLPVITSVATSAGGQSKVASAGAYLSIYGSNFAAAGVADDWSKSIVNGALPTKLDGVSVTIGGMPAYIEAVTPGQINVVTPNIPSGALDVVVTTAAGVSAPLTVTSQAQTPEFFLWPNNQVVATRTDYSYAVKNGTFSTLPTIAAKPGEVMILWGSGFGATSPAAPVGQVVPPNYYVVNGVTVDVAGSPATVLGVALAPGFAGVYQIAIQLPSNLADGDNAVVARVGGTPSPSQVHIAVQH